MANGRSAPGRLDVLAPRPYAYRCRFSSTSVSDCYWCISDVDCIVRRQSTAGLMARSTASDHRGSLSGRDDRNRRGRFLAGSVKARTGPGDGTRVASECDVDAAPAARAPRMPRGSLSRCPCRGSGSGVDADVAAGGRSTSRDPTVTPTSVESRWCHWRSSGCLARPLGVRCSMNHIALT